MIRRSYLALDIAAGHLRGVALHRRGNGSALSGARSIALPEGVSALSVRKPNVLDGRRFVDSVREVLDPLAGREERLALSLPDTVGRLLLTETETAFKTKQEGVDILKWQLKGNLGDPRDTHLDYQVLERRESGRFRLVVAAVERAVLLQYEDLIVEAGYHATVVDFHSLNLYNYYRPRLDLGEDFVLVSVERGTLSLQVFQDRMLVFHRAREVAPSPQQLFQELSRSVVGSLEQFPGLRRAKLYLHCDWPEHADLEVAVRSAFERPDLVLLDPHLERLTGVEQSIREREAHDLVAAIGAAERMM